MVAAPDKGACTWIARSDGQDTLNDEAPAPPDRNMLLASRHSEGGDRTYPSPRAAESAAAAMRTSSFRHCGARSPRVLQA